MTEPTRITAEEKTRLTDSACHLFLARNPEFFPCAANSEKLISFVHSQLGMTIDQYIYPITVDQWQVAYGHIKATSWFLERPIEEDNSAQTAEQQRALEVSNANLAACKAEEIRIAKQMPLKELGKFTSVENAKLREARDRGESSDRPVGQSSRHVEQIQLGIKARARVNVGNANPGLNPNSAEFSKKYAEELRRLRSE
jgi:hypothetical protein